MTDAGRIFEKEASKAVEHSHRAISRVQAFNRQKEQKLRIGLSALCDLPCMRTLVEAARKSTEQLTVESITACASELMLALHRGRLDIAVVDLPIKDPGIDLRTIYSETLIAVLPRQHPLAQRPMIRLLELKKEQLSIISRHIDSGSIAVEAMLRKAGVEVPSLLLSANLIDLLDGIPVHRSIGPLRSSAGRLRRDDVLYKPLADSVQLETAIAWRTDNRSSKLLSFRDALIAFGQ